jgi:hypothetical protein
MMSFSFPHWQSRGEMSTSPQQNLLTHVPETHTRFIRLPGTFSDGDSSDTDTIMLQADDEPQNSLDCLTQNGKPCGKVDKPASSSNKKRYLLAQGSEPDTEVEGRVDTPTASEFGTPAGSCDDVLLASKDNLSNCSSSVSHFNPK